MSAPPIDMQGRSHAMLVSSDPDFVDRAMDILHARMRVALVSAADGHLETVAQSTDPDLFIVDIDDVDWQVTGRMSAIEQIRLHFPDVPIAFTSYDISTSTLIPAMRAGANDVFDKSASSDEILAIADQLTSRRASRAAGGDGRVITTMGLRAGVGTTTLSLAMAQSVLESGESLGPVLYLDFSAAPCESADLLGIEPHYAMLDAINDLGRFDASVIESAFSKTASGLYVLPYTLEDALPGAHETNEVPNLIYVLKSYFKYIFVDPNRHAFARGVFDRLFCDSDVSVLCTDQSVTSIHACTNFLQSLRQSTAAPPDISLAVTRYDPRISPDAASIAKTADVAERYHVIPWDRQHVESLRNAGLPLVHPETRSHFAEAARRLMARIDEDFAASRMNGKKRHETWRKLLRLKH